jgi:hypothetical protein
MVLKVQEVIYPILELREKRQTFTNIEGDNVDIFLLVFTNGGSDGSILGGPKGGSNGLQVDDNGIPRLNKSIYFC